MDTSSTNEKTVLAADMWSIWNFGNPSARYDKFLARGRPAFKSLVESLLLYEKIVIPTQDFLSLTILVGVLGERAVLDMLEANRIQFLRLRGAFSYVGNGGGIQTIEATISTDGKSHAFCAPVDAAVDWSLSGLEEKPKDPLLPRLVTEATQEIDIKSIEDEVRHETYLDIMKSPYLRSLFAVRNQDLNRLAGIEPNGVRIYGGADGDWKGDEIDMVMSLASTNVELRLAQSINCSDTSTASPVGHLIKAKAQRSLGNLDVGQSLAVLQEIAGIPDLGEGVLERQISIAQIAKLAQSRNAEQFRDWFHRNCRENSIKTAREYVSLLRDVPKIQSLPAKIMRFITTTAVGSIPLVGPVVGALAGSVDSFFIERWLRGSSPKFFIEDIRQLQGMPKGQSEITKAQAKTGRNDPCPCGSGKKFKKCCWGGGT